MTDEDEWKKLPADQKVQHKAWKARSEGYKECIKNFAMWDEGSPEFNKYLGSVKKFVTDANELVRIQGVEAMLLFVRNANVAKKTCGEVVPGIILKCFNTKARIKEAAIDICLMYIEIDKQESTMEELIKGFSNKQPKVATACLETATKALSLFGSKVIQVKPLLKEIPTLADHRDKNVRESAKALAVEIYRWVGPAIKSSLQNVNAVLLKELEEEWAKADASGKPTQTRFMRSQQDLKEKREAKVAAAEEGGVGDSGEVEERTEVDAFDLLDPVEILSKLPKNFFEQIVAKKWQERKEMLETCHKLCENPKIEPGDFADLVKALKNVVAKDNNVMLVAIAAKCLAGLAKGLRKKFHPFAIACTDVILEKFKEKKPIVVAALQEAIDAIYPTTTIQALSETCLEYLANKNPSIKEQTGLFLARSFSKTKSSALNKSTIKPIIQSLLKNIDHSTPSVRDSAYQVVGTLLKLCGEKIVMPFLLELDNLKLEKIKEYAGKSEVGKGGAVKVVNSAEPAKKTSAPPSSKSAAAKTNDSKKKVVKGGKKPPAQKKEAKPSGETKPQEPVLSDIAVEEKVAEFLPAEVITQLENSNWKVRLEGLQSLSQKTKIADVKSIPCQALVKTLGSGKQAWKDTNFNCLNEKFAIVKYLAENALFSKTSAEICIPGLIEKVGDVKCGKSAKEAMTAVAEATSFPWVSEMMMEMSMAHKNPKIQSESLTWLSDAIKEFGLAGSNIKLFIAKIKIGFAATNPAVRAAAFSVMSAMTLYIGAKIRMFFESEKPALLQQIDAEIEKCKGESPPVPTRGAKSSKTDGGASDGDDAADEAADVKVEDLVPRTSIADKITDGLVNKLSDKNWKLRREALEEVTTILNEANFVEPNIGELATVMKQRLGDSNKILVTTTLGILSKLSVALGPHCTIHVKTLVPGLVGALADTKPNVRQGALNAMNQWLANTNLSLWFEEEMMSDALSVPKHTFLRIELLNWLAEKLLVTPKLTSSAKEGLEACVKHLYSCCEDRTGDVRAKAQAALPAFIYHLGLDKMIRLSGKLSPSSMTVVQGLVEKAKEHVPARKSRGRPKPAPSEIDVPSVESQEQEAKPPPAAAKSKTNTSAKQPKGARRPSSKKQAEEPDTAPALIKIPNGKEQRIKDEQKLKALKWVFDAPRDELVIQLKSQMTPCVGNALYTELFHADFQHHIKAINVFAQALGQQWEETVGTMDLILRWTTLRFYEKNTTVHIKCLEYLKSLFEKLIDADYRLSDYEAGGFIPHLITKIGEPKENIRKDVHAIMHQLTKVYPAGKVFTYFMQGLLTKNSRQKTECLDDLGLLITSYGIEVCQPTPPKALREIATHIGDRDNSVRSAALNVIVCAYNTCGEAVYKFVGKLNEKNMSMLEERIKRSGKFNTEPVAPALAKTEQRGLKQPSKPAVTEKAKISTSDLHSSGAAQRPESSVLGEIDESEYQMPDLLPTDIADEILNEPDIEIPPRFVSKLAEYTQRNTSETVDNTLNSIISSLASSEFDECLKSTHQLDEIMKHKDKRKLLKPRIDQILTSSCIQMRMAVNRYLVNISPGHRDNDGGDADHRVLKIVTLFRGLIAIDLAIAKEADLALCASQNVLQDYIQAVTVFMLDKRVARLPNVGRLISALNALLVELFENANPTYVMCAIIRLLHSSFEDTPDNQKDLFIRCIWKIIPLIKAYVSPPEGSTRPPLQPAPVLNEIHKVLMSDPRTQTQQKDPNEITVVRVMKSVILTFCQILGIRILDEVQDIFGVESSDLLSLITRALKSKYSTDEIEAHPVKQKLAKSVAEKKENIGVTNGEISPERKLALIMTKVGNYELTKQGLQELYDFKQQYPDYDVESGYRNMTPLFLNYIRRSLHNIEQERKNGVMSSPNILKSANTNQRLTAKEHLEHIKMLRIRCGLPADSTIDRSNKSGNQVLATNTSTGGNGTLDSDRGKDLHAPVTRTTDSESSSAAAEHPSSSMLPPRPASTSNMENLKRRLEKIKTESRKRN